VRGPHWFPRFRPGLLESPQVALAIEPESDDHDTTFQVVFVCSGNRARSPLAEALFRRHVAHDPLLKVESFGTLDVGNWPPLPGVLALAPSLGIDMKHHRSRPVREGRLANADLVVGFEPSHLELAVSLGGAAPHRTFMILELPILLDRLDQQPKETEGQAVIERARRVVEGMAIQRGPLGALPTRAVADPHGEPDQVLAEIARTIDVITAILAQELFPVD
jgi:protein-tyrosine-phosphatase